MITINGYDPSWGSHIPILIDIFYRSKGPVLELGMGVFSTPILHSLCLDKKRMLFSFENNLEYFNMHKSFVDEYHKINLVDNWDNIEIDNTHCGLAFVDHKPAERRISEVKKLKDIADYIIIHDSEPELDGQYKYSLIYSLFKFRRDYILKEGLAQTTVLSNLREI